MRQPVQKIWLALFQSLAPDLRPPAPDRLRMRRQCVGGDHPETIGQHVVVTAEAAALVVTVIGIAAIREIGRGDRPQRRRRARGRVTVAPNSTPERVGMRTLKSTAVSKIAGEPVRCI